MVEVLALVPVREGSKGLPGKNLRPLAGHPLIAYSIAAGLQANLVDRVICSTDSDEIAGVAREYGAEVPFMRPVELSNDYAGTTEVITHAVSWMHEQGWQPDVVCCIYATSVLLNKDDLVKGFEALNTGKWEYAFSVTDFESSIFRSFKEIPSGGVEMFFPEHFESRSQDLPEALHDAAQFYWGKPEA